MNAKTYRAGLKGPHIVHPDPVTEWKLNAFFRLVGFGLCPLLVPILLLFLYYGQWRLSALVVLTLAALSLTCYLAFRLRLALSVHVLMAGATLSTFAYLRLIHTPDGLYFMALMIIIAGIFLGVRDAFLWAGANSALLILHALLLDTHSVFPRLPEFFHPARRLHGEAYLSTIIFLYVASAFLSVLFQKYFSDLLTRMKDSQQEKLMLESELLQAQKLESLGIMAGGIAHEFGHGLTRIKSCANLILKKMGAQNADLAKYAMSIDSACNQVNELSTRLLAFARRKTPEMSNLNVHDLVESIVSILGFLLDKGIRIETRLEADHPVVRGNFSQLQSVLMNLALNARDAIRDKGTITISTELEGFHLVLKVADDGMGIAESDKEKIFKPFFTSKGPGKGTGLGLALSARIIESHKGTIGFESRQGLGTTFAIRLPLAAPPGGGRKDQESLVRKSLHA